MEDEPENPPAVAVAVAQPEPPETDEGEEAGEEIAAIAARVDAIDTRITEAIEGERTWTTETITSLRQELADLRATLSAATENHPAAMQTLRDELTRLSQELQAVQTAQSQTVSPPALDPPTAPPSNPPPVEGEGDPGRIPPPVLKKRRVV